MKYICSFPSLKFSAIMGAALGPKRWKLSAHSSGNIAGQEMEKGNSFSPSFRHHTLSTDSCGPD